MAQEPLRELDKLLSMFKEITTSAYEEQNQRIDSLEMKVDKICTFISNHKSCLTLYLR